MTIRYSLALVATIIVAAIISGTMAIEATEPRLKTLEMPPVPAPPPVLIKRSEGTKPTLVERQIEIALAGGYDEDLPSGGIIGGMTEFIAERGGSILRGSSLDPTLDPLRDTAEPIDSEPMPSGPGASQRAHVAEMLLKSARMLDRHSQSDPARKQLVERIRVEARKLLSE